MSGGESGGKIIVASSSYPSACGISVCVGHGEIFTTGQTYHCTCYAVPEGDSDHNDSVRQAAVRQAA